MPVKTKLELSVSITEPNFDSPNTDQLPPNALDDKLSPTKAMSLLATGPVYPMSFEESPLRRGMAWKNALKRRATIFQEESDLIRIEMIEDVTAYESKVFPISKFTLIILFLLINMTVIFLVNIKYLNGAVNFRPCTPDYYTLCVFALMIATYLTGHSCKILQLENEAKAKVRGSWPFHEHIQYTN